MQLTTSVRRRLTKFISSLGSSHEIRGLPFELAISAVMRLEQVSERLARGDSASQIADEVVRYWQDPQLTLSDESLRELISYIVTYEKGRSEAEDEFAVELFVRNCSHPAKSDLIFWPTPIFGTDNPTVDQILAAARQRETKQ